MHRLPDARAGLDSDERDLIVIGELGFVAGNEAPRADDISKLRSVVYRYMKAQLCDSHSYESFLGGLHALVY